MRVKNTMPTRFNNKKIPNFRAMLADMGFAGAKVGLNIPESGCGGKSAAAF
jgi:hypothetical protein